MAVTLGQRIQTTVRQKLMPMVADTILNSNVFAARVINAGRKWTGRQMLFPVKYATNSTFSSHSGLDSFATTLTDNRVNLAYDPSFAHISSVLPGDELSVAMNSNDSEAIYNLIRLTLESDAEDMADGVGTQFWGDGTGNNSKNFLGLAAIVDDGTTVGTIGGLSRTTYTTLKSTVTASSGTISLTKMATLFNNVTSGSVRPTVGITDPPTFSLYESLLQPQERYMKDVSDFKNAPKNGTGSLELMYKGFAILRDEKATAGNLNFLNEDFLWFYALPQAKTEPINYMPDQVVGNDYRGGMVKGLGFSWTNWIRPTNSASFVGFIYLGGQLMSNNPKRHGKLTGITGT